MWKERKLIQLHFQFAIIDSTFFPMSLLFLSLLHYFHTSLYVQLQRVPGRVVSLTMVPSWRSCSPGLRVWWWAEPGEHPNKTLNPDDALQISSEFICIVNVVRLFWGRQRWMASLHRLGGIPTGVVAVETRSVELSIPADPANLDSEAKVRARQCVYSSVNWYSSIYRQPGTDADFLICIFRSSSRQDRCGSQILPSKQHRPLRTWTEKAYLS